MPLTACDRRKGGPEPYRAFVVPLPAAGVPRLLIAAPISQLRSTANEQPANVCEWQSNDAASCRAPSLPWCRGGDRWFLRGLTKR